MNTNDPLETGSSFAVAIDDLASIQIEDALARKSTDRVWQIAMSASGTSQHAVYEAMQAHTFNVSHARRVPGGLLAHENTSLVLWPVLIDGGHAETADQDSLPLGNVDRYLAQALLTAANGECHASLLSALYSYSFIAGQGPVILRSIMESLVDRSGGGFKSEMCDPTLSPVCPTDAPALKFVVGALTRRNAWPSLPAPEHPKAVELKTKVEAALQFDFAKSRTRTMDLKCGAVDLASGAIEAGVTMWLKALSTRYGFGTWDAQPSGQDRVDLFVELMEADTPFAQIPLRAHQIGMAGVERVIASVAAMTTPRPLHALH